MINNFSANKVKAKLGNTHQCRYTYIHINNHHISDAPFHSLKQSQKSAENFAQNYLFFCFLIELSDLPAFHVLLILFQDINIDVGNSGIFVPELRGLELDCGFAGAERVDVLPFVPISPLFCGKLDLENWLR